MVQTDHIFCGREKQGIKLKRDERAHIVRVGQSHIYIRCIYNIFGREVTKYTVIYGAYTRFWPALHIDRTICCSSTNSQHVGMYG